MSNMRFEPSADRSILVLMFEKASMGDVITYVAMSKELGRDVRTFAFGALRSAKHYVQRENRIVFATIAKVGIQRIDDCEIVTSMESDRRKMAKASTRSLSKLGCADYNKLTPEKKREHTTAAAQVGAIAMFSKQATTKKISAAVTDGMNQLAIGDTLKMFS